MSCLGGRRLFSARILGQKLNLVYYLDNSPIMIEVKHICKNKKI